MLQARSAWLSSRFFSEEMLTEFGRKIREGESVGYDTRMLAQLVEELKTQKLPTISRAAPGCSILTWSLLGMMLTLGAVGALLYLRWLG